MLDTEIEGVKRLEGADSRYLGDWTEHGVGDGLHVSSLSPLHRKPVHAALVIVPLIIDGFKVIL
jgi:hypothetical protein